MEDDRSALLTSSGGDFKAIIEAAQVVKKEVVDVSERIIVGCCDASAIVDAGTVYATLQHKGVGKAATRTKVILATLQVL